MVLLLLMSISSFYAYHVVSMWEKASTYSRDGSASLGVFVEASGFLSQNLKENEMALVPMAEVFYSSNPQLRDKLLDYQSLWGSAGVILKADTTREQELRVRSFFIDFLKQNPQVRYVVRDWNDPYAVRLYEATANDELMIILREVKVMPFTLSTGWGDKITIYENVHYDAFLAMKLSSPPLRSFTIPLNASVQYDSDGVTIQKAGPRVGYYFALEGTDFSEQSYLTIQIKHDVEDLQLMISFYYDADGDGRFSGYNGTDYVKAWVISQVPQGVWYKIYQVIPRSDDPITDAAITMTGDKNGSVTLKDLIVYIQR